MNEQTTKLIEQLAQKLGTTSEYLWSILVKQAPIEATISLILFLLTWVLLFILWKTHRFLLKEDESGDNLYYEKDYLEIVMIMASFIWVFLLILSTINFLNNISGYFNPEYWALKNILGAL
jgi:heme/copper-type cytochrome/quinol oxidase subunit 2